MSSSGSQPAHAPEPARSSWAPPPPAAKAELQRFHAAEEGWRDDSGPPTPVSIHPTQLIVLAAPKSVTVAVLLVMMLGPFGMLYCTVVGALVTGAVGLGFAMLSFKAGLYATYGACLVWAGVAARQHNNRLVRRYMMRWS